MTWHLFLNHILGYAAAHAGTDEFIGWAALSAVIVTMPVPGSPLSWRTLYEWLYNALHQFSNTGKAQRPTQPTPTQTPDRQNK